MWNVDFIQYSIAFFAIYLVLSLSLFGLDLNEESSTLHFIKLTSWITMVNSNFYQKSLQINTRFSENT